MKRLLLLALLAPLHSCSSEPELYDVLSGNRVFATSVGEPVAKDGFITFTDTLGKTRAIKVDGVISWVKHQG